jgi:hypothetical protein
MQPRPLLPFHAEAHLQGLQLRCSAHWQDGILNLHYSLRGKLEAILLPRAVSEPRRCDALWQTTCFEAFLGQPGQPNYWEINLSPTGDWNLYALSDYRSDLHPETRITQLPFRVDRAAADPLDPDTDHGLDLSLVLDLHALIPAGASLELSATAVLEHRQRGCSFWAWRHSGPEADFHRRESFLPL